MTKIEQQIEDRVMGIKDAMGFLKGVIGYEDLNVVLEDLQSTQWLLNELVEDVKKEIII